MLTDNFSGGHADICWLVIPHAHDQFVEPYIVNRR
jgi:hypothetical protein